jgi:fructose-specific phosphotransferase system IIC component
MMAGTLAIVLLNGGKLSGIRNFLPVFIFQFLALLLYAVVRYILVNRFIYKPLDRLTHSVAEAKTGETTI